MTEYEYLNAEGKKTLNSIRKWVDIMKRVIILKLHSFMAALLIILICGAKILIRAALKKERSPTHAV